jgi:hypothetical protein
MHSGMAKANERQGCNVRILPEEDKTAVGRFEGSKVELVNGKSCTEPIGYNTCVEGLPGEVS